MRYERQGIEQIPTVHLDPSASQMEKRDPMNRSIGVTNKEFRRLRARIDHLQKWIAEEAANAGRQRRRCGM